MAACRAAAPEPPRACAPPRPTPAVNVKWGKQKFENVEVDTSESPLLFKTQLFALTGVPVERQKVMGLKGGQLKDDTDWATVGLKPVRGLASRRAASSSCCMHWTLTACHPRPCRARARRARWREPRRARR